MVVLYFVVWGVLYWTGDYRMSVALGLTTAVIGGYGHNWVHQTQYRHWAYMGLDVIGLSSEGWVREHIL